MKRWARLAELLHRHQMRESHGVMIFVDMKLIPEGVRRGISWYHLRLAISLVMYTVFSSWGASLDTDLVANVDRLAEIVEKFTSGSREVD